MSTALAGRLPDPAADTLVFAPGVVPGEIRHRPEFGARPALGTAPEAADRQIYSSRHSVFSTRLPRWTDLDGRGQWWQPDHRRFLVSFTTAGLAIEAPTAAAAESAGKRVELDDSGGLAPVAHPRIGKIMFTKPAGLMWDRSDIHVVVSGEHDCQVLTVAGIDAKIAPRVAARFAATVAQRRLQEREFIPEHDAQWLEDVAFGSGSPIELDWAWMYELPATY